MFAANMRAMPLGIWCWSIGRTSRRRIGSMAKKSLPCVQEVLAQVLAYVSVVRLDERRWQSSLPSLLCACRAFRAAWLALGIGQIQHSPGAVRVEGRVDLKGLRVYLCAMPHGPLYGTVVLSNTDLLGACALVAQPSTEALVGQFVFPAVRLGCLEGESVQAVTSDTWLTSRCSISLMLYKDPVGFGVTIAARRLRGPKDTIRFRCRLIGLVEISAVLRSRGTVTSRSMHLPPGFVDVATPLRISAICSVRYC